VWIYLKFSPKEEKSRKKLFNTLKTAAYGAVVILTTVVILTAPAVDNLRMDDAEGICPAVFSLMYCTVDNLRMNDAEGDLSCGIFIYVDNLRMDDAEGICPAVFSHMYVL
jgi:hypothetical protein